MDLNERLNQLYNQGKTYDSNGRVTGGVSTGATGAFGTFTKEDEARMSLDMARAQTLAELEIMNYQNQYNSPSAQAQRLREAGINPDLVGVDSNQSADASASMGSSPVGSNPIDIAGSIMNVVQTTFSMASGLMTGALSMFSGLADIDAKNISNVKELLGLGTSLAGMVAPLGNATGSSDIMNDTISGSYSSSSVAPLNSRNLRKLKKLSGVIRNSPQANAQFWSSSKEAEDARQETAKLVSSPYSADDFNEMVDCFRPVTKAIADNLLSSLRVDSKKLKFDDDYYNNANNIGLGSISASSDYASRALARDQDTMMNQMKRPLQSLIKNLDQKASEGKNWANFALISLYTALSATVQRSASQSINGSTGEVFENSSWNLGF